MDNANLLPGLTLYSLAELRQQSGSLCLPLLVAAISNPDELQAAQKILQEHNLNYHLVTLFSPLVATQATAIHQPLANLERQPELPYPLSLYVSAETSERGDVLAQEPTTLTPASESETAITPETAGELADTSHPYLQEIKRLVEVVAQLRNPEGGCPWDLEQTAQSLTPYILEEAYETIHAIQQGTTAEIAEELGDLLLQVVLQAQIASEGDQFTFAEVAQHITDKLIRRHPHVFGEVTVDSISEVKTNWEQIKAAEKGRSPDYIEPLSDKLERYPKQNPPIIAALKLSKKVAAAGLEWPDLKGVWSKFYEELAEFQEALLQGDRTYQLAELGDLLFTLINVARWCELDPSQALQLTNQKLIERVRMIETQTDQPLTDHSLEELETFWQRAKKALRQSVATAEQRSPGRHMH
jgi:XTP/dITP diphosphohydrolase